MPPNWRCDDAAGSTRGRFRSDGEGRAARSPGRGAASQVEAAGATPPHEASGDRSAAVASSVPHGDEGAAPRWPPHERRRSRSST